MKPRIWVSGNKAELHFPRLWSGFGTVATVVKIENDCGTIKLDLGECRLTDAEATVTAKVMGLLTFGTVERTTPETWHGRTQRIQDFSFLAEDSEAH